MENFIGIYENAFSEDFCKAVIRYYEDMSAGGFSLNRYEHEKVTKFDKDDSFVFASDAGCMDLHATKLLTQEFNDVFWSQCYPKYVEKFQAIHHSDPHTIYQVKIQKTDIGQGYHVWHYESSARTACNRLLAYTLYLNDVDEGGETEFLYYPKRVPAKQGTLCIFPAAFTHTHRGNPPISNAKYIITGWVEF